MRERGIGVVRRAREGVEQAGQPRGLLGARGNVQQRGDPPPGHDDVLRARRRRRPRRVRRAGHPGDLRVRHVAAACVGERDEAPGSPLRDARSQHRPGVVGVAPVHQRPEDGAVELPAGGVDAGCVGLGATRRAASTRRRRASGAGGALHGQQAPERRGVPVGTSRPTPRTRPPTPSLPTPLSHARSAPRSGRGASAGRGAACAGARTSARAARRAAASRRTTAPTRGCGPRCARPPASTRPRGRSRAGPPPGVRRSSGSAFFRVSRKTPSAPSSATTAASSVSVVAAAAGADVPRVVVDEHVQTRLVERPHQVCEAGHVVEVPLVAVVDADHRVGVPQHDGVEPAEPLAGVGEEPIGREPLHRRTSRTARPTATPARP